MNKIQTPELTRKYEELKDYFKQYEKDGICIAYSGGVDSTLLLKAAVDALSPNTVLAIILETQLHPHSDTEEAYARAQDLGAQPYIIQVDEFQNPDILHNPVNRCYLCKHLLFST